MAKVAHRATLYWCWCIYLTHYKKYSAVYDVYTRAEETRINIIKMCPQGKFEGGPLTVYFEC